MKKTSFEHVYQIVLSHADHHRRRRTVKLLRTTSGAAVAMQILSLRTKHADRRNTGQRPGDVPLLAVPGDTHRWKLQEADSFHRGRQSGH
jgi:hypothetical protein